MCAIDGREYSFDRARVESSFAGNTTPENVVMWLKKMTRVRGVMASLKRLRPAGHPLRAGQCDSFHHDAIAFAWSSTDAAARMLLIVIRTFVAGSCQCVSDVAVGFGGVAQQCNSSRLQPTKRLAGRGIRSRRHIP